jgi:hypothetical protein
VRTYDARKKNDENLHSEPKNKQYLSTSIIGPKRLEIHTAKEAARRNQKIVGLQEKNKEGCRERLRVQSLDSEIYEVKDKNDYILWHIEKIEKKCRRSWLHFFRSPSKCQN